MTCFLVVHSVEEEKERKKRNKCKGAIKECIVFLFLISFSVYSTDRETKRLHTKVLFSFVVKSGLFLSFSQLVLTHTKTDDTDTCTASYTLLCFPASLSFYTFIYITVFQRKEHSKVLRKNPLPRLLEIQSHTHIHAYLIYLRFSEAMCDNSPADWAKRGKECYVLRAIYNQNRNRCCMQFYSKTLELRK